MSKKMKSVLINLCVDLFVLAVFIVAVCVAAYKVKFDTGKTILFIFLSVVFLMINYVLALFVHELGHLYFAKVAQMKIKFVNFGLLSIDFEKGKKIKYFTFFGENAGESVFVPENKPEAKNFKLLAGGGILNSFIYCLIVFLIGFLLNSPWSYAIFIAGGCGALHIFVANILPFDKTSDGAILFRNTYLDCLVSCYQVVNDIECGKIPKKPQDIEGIAEPLCKYFDYLFNAYDGNIKVCEEIIKEIAAETDTFTEEEYICIFPEIIFYACAENRFIPSLKHLAEKYFCKCYNTLPSLRAHYAYRRFLKDDKWAALLKESYLKKLETAKPFIKRLEENLCNYAKL